MIETVVSKLKGVSKSDAFCTQVVAPYEGLSLDVGSKESDCRIPCHLDL